MFNAMPVVHFLSVLMPTRNPNHVFHVQLLFSKWIQTLHEFTASINLLLTINFYIKLSMFPFTKTMCHVLKANVIKFVFRLISSSYLTNIINFRTSYIGNSDPSIHVRIGQRLNSFDIYLTSLGNFALLCTI